MTSNRLKASGYGFGSRKIPPRPFKVSQSPPIGFYIYLSALTTILTLTSYLISFNFASDLATRYQNQTPHTSQELPHE